MSIFGCHTVPLVAQGQAACARAGWCNHLARPPTADPSYVRTHRYAGLRGESTWRPIWVASGVCATRVRLFVSSGADVRARRGRGTWCMGARARGAILAALPPFQSGTRAGVDSRPSRPGPAVGVAPRARPAAAAAAAGGAAPSLRSATQALAGHALCLFYIAPPSSCPTGRRWPLRPARRAGCACGCQRTPAP